MLLCVVLLCACALGCMGQTHTYSLMAPGNTSVALADHCGAAVAATPVIFGGNTGSTYSAIMYHLSWDNPLWDPIVMSADAIAGAPTARASSSCVSHASSMYIFGGHDGAGAFDELWKADFTFGGVGATAGTWTLLTVGWVSGPTARSAHSTVVLGNRLLVFGGVDASSNPLNDLYEYDIVNHVWTTMAPLGTLPGPRSLHVAAAVDPTADCFLVHGGYFGWSTVYSDTWRFCNSTNTWTERNNTGNGPGAMYGHSASNIDDRLVVIGGSNGISSTRLSTMYVYDDYQQLWVTEAMTGTTVRKSRHVTMAIGPILYVHGGKTPIVQSTTFAGNYTLELCPLGQVSSNGLLPCVTCAAGTIGPIGARVCMPCAAGTYADGAEMSACTLCPNGTYSNATGADDLSTCTPCPEGTFNALAGGPSLAACSPCAPGYHQPSPSSTSCLPCPNGTDASTLGSPDCSPCLPGFYSAVAATPACLPCDAGQYQAQDGQTGCDICPAGNFSLGAASSCTPCGLGKASTVVEASTPAVCETCSPGRYADVEGLSACIPCPGGSYSGASGATSAGTCTLCAPGEQSPPGATDVSNCTACPPGSYTATAHENCTLCSPGTYSTATGASSGGTCQPCPAGHELPTEGGVSLDDCSPCPIGSWASEGTPTCIPCPSGTFNAAPGATSQLQCSACVPGTVSTGGGASTCAPCAGGTYSLAGWTACEPCSDTTSSGSLLHNFDFTLSGGDANAMDSWAAIDAGYQRDVANGNAAPPSLLAASSPGSVYGASQSVYFSHHNVVPLLLRASSEVVSTVSGAADSDYAVEVTVTLDNGGTLLVNLPFPSGSPAGWVEVEQIIAVPSAVDRAVVSVRFDGSAHSGSVRFDDVQLLVQPTIACLCDNGQFYDTTTSPSSCQHCPIGHFCASGLLMKCSDLGSRMFAFGGQSSCSSCHEGWVCSDGIPTPCFDTTWSDGNGTSCSTCPAGFSCRNGRIRECPTGTYAGADAAMCTECVPGTIAAAVGAHGCTPCSDGYTSNNRRDRCFPCGAGLFSVGGAACTSCPPGSASAVGSSTCVDCTPGHYSPGGIEACAACPANTIAPGNNNYECTPCGSGLTSPPASGGPCV